MTQQQEDTPATQSAEVEIMAQDWPMIDALMGGTKTMREAGESLLPKHPAESPEGYLYRLKVSTLYNAFRRTVDTMSGKPFAEPLRTGDDMPPDIKAWTDDVDLEGRNLHAFAHDVFRTALAYGLSHVLVDFPPTTPGQTLLDERRSGARPYFVHIKPAQVVGWRSARINGAETLTQLRFTESVTIETGVWSTAVIQQVRVIEPTRFAIYRQDERKEWQLFEEGPISLGMIPLATVYADRTGFMTGRSPLIDLAYLNVEHWASSSDQSNILHVARVPILLATGFADDKPLVIGAGQAVPNENPDADLKYVEHSGKAIEAGRTSIRDIEERMSVLGAQLLVHRPGSRTATEKAIDTAEADSALSLMALNLEDALELALDYAAKWVGLPKGGTVELADDFGDDVDSMDIATLIQARQSGILSAETVFNEMQRRQTLSDEITWEQERAKLDAEGLPAVIGKGFETPPIDGAPPASPIVPGAPAPAPARAPAPAPAPAQAPATAQPPAAPSEPHPAIAAVHAAVQTLTETTTKHASDMQAQLAALRPAPELATLQATIRDLEQRTAKAEQAVAVMQALEAAEDDDEDNEPPQPMQITVGPIYLEAGKPAVKKDISFTGPGGKQFSATVTETPTTTPEA